MDHPHRSQESYGVEQQEQWLPRWVKVSWGIGLAIVLVLAGISAGVMLERNRLDDLVVLGSEWDELETVVERIEQESYYRPEDAAAYDAWQSELERGAISGLLDASGDAHAAFLPPREAEASSRALTGEYEGVGITVVENDAGAIEVVSIMLDSPAQDADVRVGDLVRAVDGTPVADAGLDVAADLLRGDAGTAVDVRFDRPGGAPYDVSMVRERLSTGESTVYYRYFEDENVAIVGITLFSLTTAEELDEALRQASEDEATQLVLDLRANPGGWVSQAQSVVGRFVDADEGAALLEDTWPAGDGMIELPIQDEDAVRYDGELLVLVTGDTASASEIVASALQYHERAVVVGEPTFGKGSVQRVHDLPSGESLRLTVAEWFTPGEVPLEGVGVDPDIQVDVQVEIPDLLPALARIFAGESVDEEIATPVASPFAE